MSHPLSDLLDDVMAVSSVKQDLLSNKCDRMECLSRGFDEDDVDCKSMGKHTFHRGMTNCTQSNREGLSLNGESSNVFCVNSHVCQ